MQSLLTSIFMLSMISVTGCGGDSPDEPDAPTPEVPTPDEPDKPGKPDKPQETAPVPGLSFTSVTFPNEGDTFACNIYGLEDGEWSAKCAQSWCNVATQGNTLKIDVKPNTESSERSTSISILHSDGSELGKISIRQCSITGNEVLSALTSTKQTFFPMFTSTWCPYSPDMDKTLTEIQKRWDYPIVPIRIHVRESALYTPLSVELSKMYDNSTLPTGYFENYFKVDNSVDDNVSIDYFWNLVLYNTAPGSGYTSQCSSLACKATMSDDVIEAEVSLSAVEPGKYRLSAFVLEDNIVKPQMSKTAGEIPDYRHNGVLVGGMTSVRGQELELTRSLKTISLSMPTPENVNLSNMRLLVVLQRDMDLLNYSDDCWYADNCLSVPLGKACGSGMAENIYVGEEIEN